MKITPAPGNNPGNIPQNGTPEHVRTAKAVAAFNKGQSSYDAAPSSPAVPAYQQPQTKVVQNQTNIAPEELSAIAPSQTTQEPIDAKIGISEATAVPTPDVDLSVKPEVEQPKDESLSRQFAQLARQERNLRAKAQEQAKQLAAEKQALEAERQAIQAERESFKRDYISKADLKKDTMRKLAETGVSYDELTQQILDTPNTDPRILAHIDRLEAKLAELEKANSSVQETFKTQEQQQYQAAIQQITADVSNLVKNSPDYETIRHTRSQKDVVDLIERTYKEDKVVMSVEEAADEVEKYLREESWKLSRLDSVRKYGESVAPKAKPSSAAPQSQPKAPQTPPPMKTLTNSHGSSRPLTSRERAILKFKGEKF
jgi:hypothetical protein